MTENPENPEKWSYGIGTWWPDEATGGLVLEVPSWRGWVGSDEGGYFAERANLRLTLSPGLFEVLPVAVEPPAEPEPDPAPGEPELPPVADPEVPTPPTDPATGQAPGKGSPK